MTETRIQHRGTCAICGNDQAVKGNLMAKHGYTVDWNQFNNACAGSEEVHYGHKNAPALIQRTIEQLTTYLNETMPQLLEKAIDDKARMERDETCTKREIRMASGRIARLEIQIERDIPDEIARLAKRKADWKLVDTYEFDVEKVAAEERKRKQAERDLKQAEKAKAEEEKAKRIAARAEKAAEKVRVLLSEQWRQIEINGVVVVEWQTAYETEGAYWRGMGDTLVEHIIEKTVAGEMSVDDYYGQSYKVIFRSRTGQGKQGKQVDKYNGIGLPINRILDDERIKKIFEERKKAN